MISLAWLFQTPEGRKNLEWFHKSKHTLVPGFWAWAEQNPELWHDGARLFETWGEEHPECAEGVRFYAEQLRVPCFEPNPLEYAEGVRSNRSFLYNRVYVTGWQNIVHKCLR